MPFKIYAGFESVSKRVQKTNRDGNAFYIEKYQEHISFSFAYKIVCIDDRFSKPVVLYKEKNVVYRFITTILNEYAYCGGWIKNILTKMLLLWMMRKTLIQVINAGYDVNYMLKEITK